MLSVFTKVNIRNADQKNSCIFYGVAFRDRNCDVIQYFQYDNPCNKFLLRFSSKNSFFHMFGDREHLTFGEQQAIQFS